MTEARPRPRWRILLGALIAVGLLTAVTLNIVLDAGRPPRHVEAPAR